MKGLYDNVDECAWYVVYTLILMDRGHPHRIFSDDDYNPALLKELKVNSMCYSVLALINDSPLSNKTAMLNFENSSPNARKTEAVLSTRVGILCSIPWTNHRIASLAYVYCLLVSCGLRTSSRNLSFTFSGCYYYGLGWRL